MKNVGFLIRALRECLGYTVEDFAKEIGISKQMLSGIELGKYGLTVRVCQKLEDAVKRITEV